MNFSSEAYAGEIPSSLSLLFKNNCNLFFVDNNTLCRIKSLNCFHSSSNQSVNMAKTVLVSSAKCFEGLQKVYRHTSEKLKCEMNFSLYLPPQAAEKKCPILYWLSGMACTEKTFIEKSGFHRYAAKHGIIVVGPDTSPRGCNIEGEEDFQDFGSGASFYFDATEDKWKNNYRMYSYVTKELPALINQEFPNSGKSGISGHSMGGHGALIIALRNPEKYLSVSAFAPNTNPSAGSIGQKALTGYMGCDRNSWADWDATLLAKTYSGPEMDILIDQGTDDSFLVNHLKPQNFINACKGTRINPILRMRQDYDHSYMFVSTFIGDHFDYHAKHLCH